MNNPIWNTPLLVALSAGARAQNSPTGAYNDGATNGSTLGPGS